MIDTPLQQLLSSWQGLFKRMEGFSPLVLLGASHVAQVLPLLNQHGVHPEYILDNDTSETEICGTRVVRPEGLKGLPHSAGICVCRLGGVELVRDLEAFTDCPVIDAFLPIGSEMFAPHFDPRIIAGSMDRIEAARELFIDDASRDLFDHILAFRLTCDLRLMPLATMPMYHHPSTAPRAGDVIIDAGAYDGDTALDFARATNNKVRIYSFEPDKENVANLRRNIARAGLDRIVETIPMALWDKDEDVLFTGSSTTARIGEDEGTRAPATTLDTFCSSRNIKPTLIKMDLEGADYDALRGAGETISTHRPRLALSIYHRPEDLWEIPLLAAELRPNSTFHLVRHASPEALAEITCYVS